MKTVPSLYFEPYYNELAVSVRNESYQINNDKHFVLKRGLCTIVPVLYIMSFTNHGLSQFVIVTDIVNSNNVVIYFMSMYSSITL